MSSLSCEKVEQRTLDWIPQGGEVEEERRYPEGREATPRDTHCSESRRETWHWINKML